jgi:hypothetical protein
MARPVPAIHAFVLETKAWMPGIKPGMTDEHHPRYTGAGCAKKLASM